MGVWIETDDSELEKNDLQRVTPFVGVWIETVTLLRTATPLMSHPSWVCGLKQGRVATGM